MRIVFDGNVPWPLRKFLPDHDVTSVQLEGLGGMENGKLLEHLDGTRTGPSPSIQRTSLMGAMRPQTPHRSTRQAFGGNLIKTCLRQVNQNKKPKHPNFFLA